MGSPRISIVSAACIAAALAATPALRAGRAHTHQQPPSPSYFTDVNLVLVDMRVTRGGDPVPDLRADEVTLLVDGTPRPVVSLLYAPVVVPTDRHPAPTPAPHTSVSAPQPPPSRRVVFVVDRESIAPGEARQLQKTIEAFIARVPTEIAIAVATLPLGPSMRFDPDRAGTLQALGRAFEGTIRRGTGLEGIGGFGCTDDAASEGCGSQGIHPSLQDSRAREMNRDAEWKLRGRKALGDLEWIFRTVAGSPSDVVIVSGGLPFTESLREGMRADIDRVFAVAQSAGVRVHAIEIRDLRRAALPEGGASTTLDLTSLRQQRPAGYGLPEETGGVSMTGAVSGADFFKQLTRELSSTYILSFEPSDTDRDGAPHAIEVRIARRPQPTVHARKAFIAARPTRPSITSAAPASAPTSAVSAEARDTSPPERTNDDAAVAAPSSGTIPLPTVMQHASAYVDAFERSLSSLVAEERYVQVVKAWRGDPPSPGQESELRWKPGTGEQLARSAYDVSRRRQLLSDVLLVQPPGEMWIGYRDVAEVNGKAVRDRALRIEKLFLSDTSEAREQLQRIADESARYNLGPSRNINIPTFPLQILRPTNLPRFEWTTRSQTRTPTDPAACTVVGFRETADPTLVRTNSGRNVPMSGQFCIEPDTGRVWRATLHFKERFERVEGAFEVTFRPTPSGAVLVPEQAWEWSLGGSPLLGDVGSFVEGQATYTNLRRFSVNTEEQLK